MRYNNSGRTMIEMIGVLGIMGLLSVGGLAGFSQVMSNHKINQAFEQINVISAKLSAIGAKGSDYSGLSNATAVKFGAVPDEAIASSDGSSLVNPFGGSIRIAADSLADSTTTDNMAYTITYSGLPRVACLRMASGDFGSGETSSVIGFGVSKSPLQIKNVTDNLYQDCSGKKDEISGYIAACYGGSDVDVPIPMAMLDKACSCGENPSCVFVIKYF